MFGTTFPATLKSLKLVSVDENHNQVQRAELGLECDATADFVSSLDEIAGMALDALHDRSLKRAVMPIDRVACHAIFGTGEGYQIKDCRGVEATLKIGSKEDADPVVRFKLVFSWTEESIVFVARHFGRQVDLRLVKAQMSLPGTEDKEEGTVRRRKGANNGTDEQPVVAA